jgi:pantetheine-phosphate adenylyltransferase
MRKVIYPGTFDPLTNGHLDIAERASKIFDQVVVAVAKNEQKKPLFSLEKRRMLVEEATKHLANVKVDTFNGLLIEYVKSISGCAIIRGLRAVSDFEYELQLALMNRRLVDQIETIFMAPKDTYAFLSSRLVKEIAQLGGNIGAFVPEHVKIALQNEFRLSKT